MLPFWGASTRGVWLGGGGDCCGIKPCCDAAGENGAGDAVATRFGTELVWELKVWFCMTGDGLAVAEPTFCRWEEFVYPTGVNCRCCCG